jgi:hypothetical protein
VLTLGLTVAAGLLVTPPSVGAPPAPAPTESWVDDWDLPGMKAIYVRNLGAQPVEVTGYTLDDCHNVGLLECGSETPSSRVIPPGATVRLVVVGPSLSALSATTPSVSFRYTYRTELRPSRP